MSGSGPTLALAAATAFAQVSVTGIGDPDASVGSQWSGRPSHVTFGPAAALGDGDVEVAIEGIEDDGALDDGDGRLLLQPTRMRLTAPALIRRRT